MIGRRKLASGRYVYVVGVYHDGHWLTTVVFKNKLLALLFHIVLNASDTHEGSRYA